MVFLNKRSNFEKKQHELSYRFNTSVCLIRAGRKYVRVKETDNVKLDKKKKSVSFALMYFLSAPVRQTEV